MSAVPQAAGGSLRLMTEKDLREVMEIETRAYQFPWTKSIMRDCLRVGYHCWVMELRERIEAYGILSVAAGEAHLLNLCVRPESQGQGLARGVLAHLLQVARAYGAETIFLEVRPSNPGAIRLYQGMGFCEVGLRRDYYPASNGREDALVMARQIRLQG